jgi:hypothetical protein
MKRFLFAVSLFLACAGLAHAAGIPVQLIPGPWNVSQIGDYIGRIFQAVNQYASGYQPINVLDNGAMLVNQRGAAARAGGAASGPGILNYGPDRWAVDTNVTSGVGYSNEVTSAAGVTFAPGFSTMMSVYRNSGALTQPIVAEQEIKSASATLLAGRNVILSCWLAANGGAPAGVTATLYLWTGTGTDEGLGALRSAVGMTASPALTPALAGLATAGSFTTPALTSTATRYSSGLIGVPSTATEAIFGVAWTPGAETAGATDGILMTGCQVEEAESAQVAAGRFYRPSYQDELLRASAYYQQIIEAASRAVGAGECTATNVEQVVVPVGQPFDVLPTLTVTAGGFKENIAGTATAITTLTIPAGSNTGPLTIADTTACTAGNDVLLVGSTTTGKLTFSADF